MGDEAKRDDRYSRYLQLPPGEAVKEAARDIEGRNPALAKRLRGIVKEYVLPCAGDHLDEHGNLKPHARQFVISLPPDLDLDPVKVQEFVDQVSDALKRPGPVRSVSTTPPASFGDDAERVKVLENIARAAKDLVRVIDNSGRDFMSGGSLSLLRSWLAKLDQGPGLSKFHPEDSSPAFLASTGSPRTDGTRPLRPEDMADSGRQAAEAAEAIFASDAATIRDIILTQNCAPLEEDARRVFCVRLGVESVTDDRWERAIQHGLTIGDLRIFDGDRLKARKEPPGPSKWLGKVGW